MLAVSTAALIVDVRQGNFPPSAAEARARAETTHAAQTPHDAQVPAAPRPVFPYSVVPGGVHSVGELQRAIAQDPVVAAHYRDFDLSKAHVERLAIARHAYVSFRIGSHIFWTRKPLVLPAGERVITDGTLVARTRCGNQVADRPGATSPVEPAAMVLDTPVDRRVPAAGFPGLPTPAAVLPGGLGREVGVVGLLAPGRIPSTERDTREPVPGVPAQGAPLGNWPNTPAGLNPDSEPEMPIPVPEPASLTLLATGTLLIARKLRARRAH